MNKIDRRVQKTFSRTDPTFLRKWKYFMVQITLRYIVDCGDFDFQGGLTPPDYYYWTEHPPPTVYVYSLLLCIYYDIV